MQKINLFHYFDKKDDGESSSRPNASCDVHTSNKISPPKSISNANVGCEKNRCHVGWTSILLKNPSPMQPL